MAEWVFLAVAVLLATGCTKPKTVEAKPEKSGPVKVAVEPVRSRTILRSVEAVGTLFPYDETTISAEVDGQVLKVNADLGDMVRKGQVLVQLSQEEQRYVLAQNEAQLRSSLERLGLKNENDRVQDIKQVADVRRAQANLTDAEQRYQRSRTLVDQGIAAQADLDQAAARLKTAQA